MKNKKLKLTEVIICLVLSFSIIFISGILIASNINYDRTYKEPIMLYDYLSDINYSVNLDANEYYGNTLGEDNQYIGSLINNIDLDFKYNLNSNKEFVGTVNYKIKSKLLVDYRIDTTTNTLLQEESVLIDETIDNTSSKISIDENIKLDYKYYNNYINNYRESYSLSSLSSTIIYTMEVNVSGICEGKEVNNVSTSTISVPLLNQFVNITKTSNSRVNTALYNESKLPLFKSISFFILGLLFLSCGLLLLIPLFMAIGLVRKQDTFRRTVKKYLRIYDEIIVESSVVIDVSNKEIIEITNFNDLIDAEQELHIPIVYTEIKKNEEGWFTITTNNQVWRYILKNNE